MSHNDDDDMGTMAWPGFVDILSSVIIMFVFFVMVVASALYFHIIIFKSKILSEVDESTSSTAQESQLSKTNRTLMEKIEEMEEKMQIMEDTTTNNEIQLFQQNTDFEESLDQKVEENVATKTITIFYGKDAISIDQDREAELRALIDKYSKQFGSKNVKVRIVAGKNPNSVNDIVVRRLAVARMLNTRNLFLNTEIPGNQVIPSIAGTEEIDGTHNWVQIIFEDK